MEKAATLIFLVAVQIIVIACVTQFLARLLSTCQFSIVAFCTSASFLISSAEKIAVSDFISNYLYFIALYPVL